MSNLVDLDNKMQSIEKTKKDNTLCAERMDPYGLLELKEIG